MAVTKAAVPATRAGAAVVVMAAVVAAVAATRTRAAGSGIPRVIPRHPAAGGTAGAMTMMTIAVGAVAAEQP